MTGITSRAGIIALLLAGAHGSVIHADVPSKSQPELPPLKTGKYAVAWEETFDGAEIDSARWYFRTDSKALSTQLKANAVIENAGSRRVLRLHMRKVSRPVQGKNYTGAGIVTKHKFGYGYYEVQAKNTTNKGWHNSFWMMAGTGESTMHAGKFLEIDSAEIDTSSTKIIPSGIQIWSGTAGYFGTPFAHLGSIRCKNNDTKIDLTQNFHTYGVNWREGFIDFYFDNIKYCQVEYKTSKYRQDPVNIWLTAIGYNEADISVNGTQQYYDNLRFYKKDQYVYSGRWGYSEVGKGWMDSKLPGFGLMPQRTTCSTGETARYGPGFLQSGRYKVSIWKTTGKTQKVRVTVNSSSGSSVKYLDFSAGASRWVDLGVFRFVAGKANPNIGVSSTLLAGCQRASAVKFVRQ